MYFSALGNDDLVVRIVLEACLREQVRIVICRNTALPIWLDPDFAAAAFKIAKPGDFTKPVHTQFGYHIIKLLKKDPKGYLPLDKVKQDIRDFLVDKTVSEEIQAMIKAERAKGDIKIYEFTSAKAAEKPAAGK